MKKLAKISEDEILQILYYGQITQIISVVIKEINACVIGNR